MRMISSSRDRLGAFGISRPLAVLGAVLIVAGQLAAAVHSHETIATERSSACAELSADNGLCALCLLAFHSTPKPSAAPSITRPDVGFNSAVRAAEGFVESPVCASTQTRAPPALA